MYPNDKKSNLCFPEKTNLYRSISPTKMENGLGRKYEDRRMLGSKTLSTCNFYILYQKA